MLTPHCVRMLTAGVRTHALSPYAHNVGVSRLVAVPVPPVKVRTHLQSHGNRTTITLQSHSNHTPMARQSHSNHTPITLQWHGNGTAMALQWHSNHTPMAHQWHTNQCTINVLSAPPGKRARTSALQSLKKADEFSGTCVQSACNHCTISAQSVTGSHAPITYESVRNPHAITHLGFQPVWRHVVLTQPLARFVDDVVALKEQRAIGPLPEQNHVRA